MTARQTAEDGVQEPRYSAWRDLADMVLAIVGAVVVIGAWFYVLPWIAAWAGGR